jgi:hypothetical protein
MRIELWDGGKKLLEVPGNVVDTNLSLASGHHDVIAVGVEVDTSTFSDDVSFDVSSPTPPPPPPPPGPSDFAVTVSPATQVVKRGGSATFNVSIAPENGAFDSAIALACSGLANGMGCSFSPATLTPGSGSASATLTLSTSSSVSSSIGPASPFSGSFAVVCALVLPLAGVICFRDRRKGIHKISALCVLLALGLTLQSCGGGAAAPQPSSPLTSSSSGSGGGTPQSATSTVTILATSGSTAHSTTVTLTVQQ